MHSDSQNILLVGMLVFFVGLASNACAQERQVQWPNAVSWLGEPERRLHSQVGDLVQVESQEDGRRSSKRTSTWESQRFGVGDWSATTTFHVVDGRVKRLLQEAVAPQQFCDETSDWGAIGNRLSQELESSPMVYAPTIVSGQWQQAALWHANRVTVVLYRTLAIDGECRVKTSIQ